MPRLKVVGNASLGICGEKSNIAWAGDGYVGSGRCDPGRVGKEETDVCPREAEAELIHKAVGERINVVEVDAKRLGCERNIEVGVDTDNAADVVVGVVIQEAEHHVLLLRCNVI